MGQIAPVEGTPFDFRSGRNIDVDRTPMHYQLEIAGGYDHNFVVDGVPRNLRPVAEVSAPGSGRTLSVSSTQPGVQFYSGNNLGGVFKTRSGFCLGTQHFPDSPNQPAFPSTLVTPKKLYSEKIVFKFGIQTADKLKHRAGI